MKAKRAANSKNVNFIDRSRLAVKKSAAFYEYKNGSQIAKIQDKKGYYWVHVHLPSNTPRVLDFHSFAVHFCTVAERIEDLLAKGDINRVMLTRVSKAGLFCESVLRRAYTEVFHSSSGNRGGVGAISHEVQSAENFLSMIMGVGDEGKHIAYREYGVKPAPGALYDAHSKIPPITSIYDYLRISRFTIPDGFVKQAARNEKRAEEGVPAGSKFDSAKPWYSSDPLMLWAANKAFRIKAEGVPPLGIIAKTLDDNAKRIEEILDGK